MAKEKAKAKEEKAKGKAKEEKAAEREMAYGVEDIAEALGIKPASVRVQLRNKGIEKAGKSYGWATKAELKEVISQLKSDDGDDEDEKPSKKAAAKDKAGAKSKDKAKGKKKPKDDEDDD